jgi:hypothetical protein
MPALNSSTWRSQKLTVATILPCAAPTLRHSRTRPEPHRKPVTQRPRKRSCSIRLGLGGLAFGAEDGPSFVNTNAIDNFGPSLRHPHKNIPAEHLDRPAGGRRAHLAPPRVGRPSGVVKRPQ